MEAVVYTKLEAKRASSRKPNSSIRLDYGSRGGWEKRLVREAGLSNANRED